MSDLKIIADRLLSAMESLGYGGAKMRDKPQIVSRSMKTVEDELHMERETLCRSFEGLVDFYRTQMSRSQRPTDRKVIKQAAKQFSLNSDQAAALILGSQACPSKK